MAKEGSVAPKERINIKYVPATGDQQAEIELPLKLVVLGDFKGHPKLVTGYRVHVIITCKIIYN